MHKVFTLIFSISLLASHAQELVPFKIYNSKGKAVKYKKMVKSMDEAEVILFGELHNNSIAHWVQLELSKTMVEKKKVAFGAEMFERDNHKEMADYMAKKIEKEAFDTLVRLWKNYETDYAPLVELARNNELEFHATNIPRRFASLVYKGGFEALDSLSEEEKTWIAPLPITYDPEVACYKNILAMSHGHGGANLPKAQAAKDATMAHFILKNMDNSEVFIHFNGSYHSDNHEGIVWYLKHEKPEGVYMTITTKLQSDVNKLQEEHLGTADFIIVVDEDMTNTY